MSYRIETSGTLAGLEANVDTMVTNYGFECRGGIFFDNQTGLYCQALEK